LKQIKIQKPFIFILEEISKWKVVCDERKN
jgi:hypothetical protein